MLLKYSSSKRSQNAHIEPQSCTGAPAMISSGDGFGSGSVASTSVICGFSFSKESMRSRLLTHFFQMGIGMWVDIDPEMSNCAEMSIISASTSCAAHFATVATYASVSTFSCLSVPFLPRLATRSASFASTISYVTFSLGAFITSRGLAAPGFSPRPFLPTTANPSSTSAPLCAAFSAAFCAFFSAFSAFRASSSDESSSLSLSEPSSSVESGCSLARANPAAIAASSRKCFFSLWRMELNALAFVEDIFLIAGLFANVCSIAASKTASARK